MVVCGASLALLAGGVAVAPAQAGGLDRARPVATAAADTAVHAARAAAHAAGKVLELKVTGKATAGKRDVRWRPPADDGGRKIQAYKVIVKKPGRQLVNNNIRFSEHHLMLSKKQLEKGKLVVKVKAFNYYGWGAAAKVKFKVR
jgi:hypothetical protein